MCILYTVQVESQLLIELLWGRQAPPSRGPKPSLTVGGIVDTAIGIAEVDGLGAVSMRRLAEELGMTTMALYRYIPGKDGLLHLMFDAGVGTPPAPAGRPGPWRAELVGWARAMRARYRQRPWLAQMPITGPPLGPNNLAWMEAAVRALQRAGLPPEQQVRSLLLLAVFVRGEALLDLGLARAEADTGTSLDEQGEAFGTLLAALDAERFPALVELVRTGVFVGQDEPDADFEFSLARILDGIEALLPERPRPR